MSLYQPLIVIADDDDDDQQLLQEVLLHVNPSVSIVSLEGGSALLDFLKSQETVSEPALLVLDYNMPDMNAVEVLEYLSGSEEWRSIPAVVWSTSNLEHTAKKCLEKGAREYFIKPIDLNEAINTARKMLLHCGLAQA